MTGTDQSNFITAAYQAGPGIQFVVGRLKGQTTTTVQSVLFDKGQWTLAQARTWLREHEFRAPAVDETEERLRFRQREPGEFEPGSLRTISAGRRDNAKDDLDEVHKFLDDAELDEIADFLRGAGFEVIDDPDWVDKLLAGTLGLPGDDYLTEGDDLIETGAYKTVGGAQFQAGDWAYAPEESLPATWKLRLTSVPGGRPVHPLVEAAVAAVGPGGYRGCRVQIPEAAQPAVLKALRAAWAKSGQHAQMPESIQGKAFRDGKGEDKLFSLKNVEIFRTGEWNGDKYTRDDLHDMVRNFNRVGFRPPVKLGHAENSGEPAYGWVETIKVVGDRLVADFMDLPRAVYTAIKQRRYDHVSAEIFWNLKRAGKTFRRALKAVALLGTETPAVADLKPLRDSIAGLSGATFEGLRSYQLSMEDLMAEKDEAALKKLEAQLAEQAEAMKALQAENEELKAKGKGDDETALALKEMAERQELMAKQLAEAQEREKQARIDSEVDKVKIPAFKDFFGPLFELCAATEVKTVKFKTEVKGKDDEVKVVEQDTDPVEVVRALRDAVNKKAAILTAEHAIVDSGQFKKGMDERYTISADSAGAEVDRLAKAYMVKHKLNPKTDYAQALDAVLLDPENADVAARYQAS